MSILGGVLLAGCAAQHSDAAPAAPASRQGSILVGSSPAPGSSVEGPVDELKLRFDPPARLNEVTVSGPDGQMPAMIHAVGEAADYSIPLSGLETGAYTVAWRATVRGAEHRGSFAFTVR